MRGIAILLCTALATPLAACEGEVQEVVEVRTAAPPDTPVVDAAELIPAEAEAALVMRLADYYEESGTAIVVNTTDSLGGRTIDNYARSEFNGWGIGDADTHRGVLVLIAPTERKARIEVGCGLETVLTDEVAQRVMDMVLIPALREGDYPEATANGVEAIIATIEDSPVEPGPSSPYCIELMEEAA